jgi:hypothetical protein
MEIVMSVKTLAAMSAAILLASVSLASAQTQVRARAPAHAKTYATTQTHPYGDSYFNQEYWKDVGQFIVPSDPDPTKGTVFGSH